MTPEQNDMPNEYPRQSDLSIHRLPSAVTALKQQRNLAAANSNERGRQHGVRNLQV